MTATGDRGAAIQARHLQVEATSGQHGQQTGLWAKHNRLVEAHNGLVESHRGVREGVKALAGIVQGERFELRHLDAMLELQRTHSAATERRVRLLEGLLVDAGVLTADDIEEAADDIEDRAQAINDVHYGYWDLNRAIDRYHGHIPKAVLDYVGSTPPERRTPEALRAALDVPPPDEWSDE